MKKFRFYKEGKNWYVDLPEWTGQKSDLLMIGGADTMLDILSKDTSEVIAYISETNFEGADELKFKARATDVGEGAYYFLEKYEGNALNLSVFLCDVTLFVFGKFPEKLFIAVATDELDQKFSEKSKTVIFGLSPMATFINGIIMSILSGVSWSISFLKQIPAGTKFTDAAQIKDLEVPWYCDMPFTVLGMVLLFAWAEHRFNLKPGELSFKAMVYKYVYSILIISFIEWITKIIILSTFLN